MKVYLLMTYPDCDSSPEVVGIYSTLDKAAAVKAAHDNERHYYSKRNSQYAQFLVFKERGLKYPAGKLTYGPYADNVILYDERGPYYLETYGDIQEVEVDVTQITD